jgi:hypothetical protein
VVQHGHAGAWFWAGTSSFDIANVLPSMCVGYVFAAARGRRSLSRKTLKQVYSNFGAHLIAAQPDAAPFCALVNDVHPPNG